MPSFNNQFYSAVLLDIEGTTTPVDFVYKTLFPFARNHVEAFLQEHSEMLEVRSSLAALCEENVEDLRNGLAALKIASADDLPSIVSYIHWLIDINRKSTPLKSLQGMIWQAGYESGELQSELFADVPVAFSKWQEQGTIIAIFSSGSVLAQKLLFAHTSAGDLTSYIADYFDTNVGAKKEAESYRRIAQQLQKPAADILFLSDVTAELDAAAVTGMQTCLSLRPGNAEQPPSRHNSIHTFAELFS